jgi:hypothetical protein
VALTALVRAVASAQSEGMFVQMERLDATTGSSDGPVPSVFVDGVRASTSSAIDIHDAIVRAHRRPARRQSRHFQPREPAGMTDASLIVADTGSPVGR